MVKVASKKCIIIDDELRSQIEKEDFLIDIGLPKDKALFAGSHEEALAVIEENRSSISVCLLDCRIPKNNDFADYERESINLESEWGIKLIPFLSGIKTLLYSAHVPIDFVKKKFQNATNVVACLDKVFLVKDYQNLEKIFKEELDVRQLNKIEKKAAFDYDLLDKETAEFIKDRASKINTLSQRIVQDTINIGRYLIEVQDKLYERNDRNFVSWIRTEFPWEKSRAYVFIKIAKKFPNVGNIDPNITLAIGVLEELSNESVPQEVIDEVFEKAKKEKVPRRVAVEIIEKYKEKEKSTSSNDEKLKILKVSHHLGEKEPEINLVSDNIVNPKLLEEKNPKKVEEKVVSIPEIITVKHNLVKNSYWKLGEKHRLFCGYPQNSLFLNQLPSLVSLLVNLSPNESSLLEKSVTAETRYCFQSQLKDINSKSIKSSLEQIIFETVPPEEVVVFAHFFDPSLFNLAVSMECICYAAEPDLDLCQQLLDLWRKKGDTVKRIG